MCLWYVVYISFVNKLVMLGAREQNLLNQKAELEAMKNDANKKNHKLMVKKIMFTV